MRRRGSSGACPRAPLDALESETLPIDSDGFEAFSNGGEERGLSILCVRSIRPTLNVVLILHGLLGEDQEDADWKKVWSRWREAHFRYREDS